MELLRLLAQHNQQFKKPSLYEPSKHSTRDVKKVWECMSVLCNCAKVTYCVWVGV